MRKTCQNCGLINFETAEICRKCGSKALQLTESVPYKAIEQSPDKSKRPPFWADLLSFGAALFIEFLALLPVLANMGMNHASGAQQVTSFGLAFVVFIFHLPTVLITYVLSRLIDPILLALTPITQIIFWTLYLPSVWKKIRAIFTG